MKARITIPLFEEKDLEPDIEDLVTKAKEAIAKLFINNQSCVIAFSGGKDSSCVSSLVLATAKELVATGQVKNPFILVTTGDTLVENPSIRKLYRSELAKMEKYAEANGFKVYTEIVTPGLSTTFQIKVLSGRGLPSYASQNSDCSQDLKIKPMQAYRRKLFKRLSEMKLGEPVTLIGTRFDESERRALHMKMRGENALTPVLNKDDEMTFSPICMWSTESVWEYIGYVASGLMESYTNFEDVKRIYAHAEGQSCAIVAEGIREGLTKRKKGGCGSRFGCVTCVQVATDKSMQNMVDYDEQYSYGRGLLKLNAFLQATRYDLSRRNWVGRTIKEGYIQIQPDTFSAGMVRELFRYMAQLDYDEAKAAEREWRQPMFKLLTVPMIIAIDALQSMTGLAKPFQCWADIRDIYERGVRYDIPTLETFPKVDIPDAMFLKVGNEWDDSSTMSDLTGLRDAYTESLLEISACGKDLREIAGGKMVWDIDAGQSFEVDEESAFMIQEFEYEYLLRKYDAGYSPGGITEAYKYYLSYGVLTLSHSQVTSHDEILRRTSFKDRLGLTLDYDVNELLKQSVRFADMPLEARQAWGYKATTESAQVDLILEPAIA